MGGQCPSSLHVLIRVWVWSQGSDQGAGAVVQYHRMRVAGWGKGALEQRCLEVEGWTLNDCLRSRCQTEPTPEAELRGKSAGIAARVHVQTVSTCVCTRERRRCWGGRKLLFSCLPAKTGADPQCSNIQIQVKFNPSYHPNPCQSRSQAVRQTDLHFQHRGECHTRKHKTVFPDRANKKETIMWWLWPSSVWWWMLIF